MLEQIWKRILRREPVSLWHFPAVLLWFGSLGYRVGLSLKRGRTKELVKVDVPVISIGNISVGGTGKTPMVNFLAQFLLADGLRVGIVSSGYARQSEEPFVEPGYRVRELEAAETGDEVKLLALSLPEALFSVHPQKHEAARRLAETGKVDVIIVDDGFQHWELARDIDIVTYDAAIKPHLLRPFPAGVLREPLSALKRADIIIITRSNFAKDILRLQNRLRAINPKAQHYHAQFESTEIVSDEQALSVKYLEDKSVFLFAGVGNFRILRKQVKRFCASLDEAMELSDHQIYTPELLADIKRRADEQDSDVILTTQKDWVKIGDFDFGREAYYLNQEIDLDPGEEKLIASLVERLQLDTDR